jgi:hypothetical protein
MSRPRHTPTIVLSALILALLVWYFWPAPPHRTPSFPTAASVASDTSTAPQSKIENPNSKISAPAPAERSTLADALNSPTSPLRADLSIVHEVITAFRTNFPRDGNPVGTNAEITAVLTGQNKLRLALIPPDHPAINRTTGELLDRWGTPFFFHAESGTRTSITSAGPDKKLHTPDDETFTP